MQKYAKLIDSLILLLLSAVHIFLALYMLFLGNVLLHPFFTAQPNPEDIPTGWIIIITGIIIIVTSVFALVKKSFTTYLSSIGIVILTMIAWMIFISPYDALPLFIVYILVALPLTLVKYFINRK